MTTKVLSRQAYFCCDKRRVLSRQTRAFDKTCVACDGEGWGVAVF